MRVVVNLFLLISFVQEVAVSMDQEDRNIQPDAQSVQSVTSLNLESKDGAHNQQRITRQDTSDHNARSGERKHFT